VTYTKTLDSAWVTYPFPHWVYFYGRTNYLAKFDKNGQKLWIKDVGMHNQHYYAISTDYSNNILFTGHFWGDYPFILDTITLVGTAIDNIFIAKYSPDGQILWAQRAGGGSNGNQGYDIIADTFNNIYMTGKISGGSVEFGGIIFFPNSTHNKAFLTKYDSAGTVIWAKRIYGVDPYYNITLGFSLKFKNDEIYLVPARKLITFWLLTLYS